MLQKAYKKSKAKSEIRERWVLNLIQYSGLDERTAEDLWALFQILE